VSLRRAILITCSVVAALLVLVGASGYVIFTRAKDDALQRADAVIVLSGEHDGREDFGLRLARLGWAPTVVLSDVYPPGDPIMRRACDDSDPIARIEVICERPFPLNTRGEADMTRRLANERGWSKVIVVSWRYHLPRAKVVFDRCISGEPDSIVMQAVPRRYNLSFVLWESVYAYQYAGLLKAILQGECD
jgi:uncharacterized SAM-binding protein YcdF (DUF218 family)